MKKMVLELLQYRQLLGALTKRNIKVRYKQTVMGFLWAIFMPLIMVLAGIIIKKAMAIFSGRPLEFAQVLSVTVKALPWAFFMGAVKFSVNSLVGNSNLVKKTYFPREVFPFSYVLVQLFDFTVASAVLIILLSFAKIGVSIYFLWLPLILLFFILLTTALGLILACGNVFFRDVKYIVDVIFTFGMFFTPVFFEASMFGKWGVLFLLNPVGALLENIHYIVVLHRAPDLLWLTYAGIWAVCGFLVSLVVFKRAEPYFAECI